MGNEGEKKSQVAEFVLVIFGIQFNYLSISLLSFDRIEIKSFREDLESRIDPLVRPFARVRTDLSSLTLRY